MDTRLSDQNYFFVYDPILFGYSTAYWKDISGAATVSSNKIRLNATTIGSKEQYVRPEITFRLTVPTAPTTSDDRKFGLVSPAQGLTKNAAFFKIAGTAFTAQVVNAAGTATSTTITWNAAWTNTAADYKISWLHRSVAFYINGLKVAEVLIGDETTLLPDPVAVSAYLLNANADNMDLTYMLITSAEKFVLPKDLNISATIATSDIQIGAVEIKNGTDDTRAVVSANGLLVDVGRVQGGVSLESSSMYNGTTALTPKFAVISASSSGNNTIVAAVTSKKIRVLGYVLVANGAVNVKFQSAAGGTDKTGLLYLAANGGVASNFSPVGLFETVAGELLNLNLSGAVAVGGHLVYVEI